LAFRATRTDFAFVQGNDAVRARHDKRMSDDEQLGKLHGTHKTHSTRFRQTRENQPASNYFRHDPLTTRTTSSVHKMNESNQSVGVSSSTRHAHRQQRPEPSNMDKQRLIKAVHDANASGVQPPSTYSKERTFQ
jgi:hypothetical protein